jgi:hypothetical protein
MIKPNDHFDFEEHINMNKNLNFRTLCSDFLQAGWFKNKPCASLRVWLNTKTWRDSEQAQRICPCVRNEKFPGAGDKEHKGEYLMSQWAGEVPLQPNPTDSDKRIIRSGFRLSLPREAERINIWSRQQLGRIS